MFKKLICLAITASLIINSGCKSSEIILRNDYKSLDEYEGELFVVMKDSTSQTYSGDEYKVIQDTLYVLFSPKKLSGGNIIQPDPPIKIPIEDIASNQTSISVVCNLFINGLIALLFLVTPSASAAYLLISELSSSNFSIK